MSTADFEARVLRTLTEHQMLENGDTVIVALSGGGDSMALFHFLSVHAENLGVRLRAAHVNHGVRGAASDADEAFVRAECARRGIPLDVRVLSLGGNASEDAARAARYAFFDELHTRFGAKIATAHTASDQAETVLLRLARGTMLDGAAGIPHVRGAYIRPLLDVCASDARAYLARSGIPYRDDETNASDAYARNRVRHQAVPALESVSADAVLHIARFAADVRCAASCLNDQGEALVRAARRAHPAEVLETYDADALMRAPRAVRLAALRILIGRSAEITRARVEACEALLVRGGALTLNGSVRFCVRRGLARVEPVRTVPPAWEMPFSTGEFALPDGRVLKIEKIPVEKYEKMRKDGQKPLFSCADYDKIKNSTLLRGRRAGDRFSRPGRSGAVTLKKLLNETGLSCAARAALVVCARGGCILWASGFGASAEASPSAGTREIAVITIGKRGTI